MEPNTSFFTPDEEAINIEFLEHGFVIRPVDNLEILNAIRAKLIEIVTEYLNISKPDDPSLFLNNIENILSVEKLNDLRLHTYHTLNAVPWFRPAYYSLAKSTIQLLVGNELAMQNRVNLSIQLPEDDSSLLPIHADAFGGETPFQVVVWLPFVDCFKTKSMFILPREKCKEVYSDFNKYSVNGMEALYDDVYDDLVWCNVPYGNVLIFSPNQLHGGVINKEPDTRWSMNCRFTGLFTPYRGSEKKLGSFYLPITTRAVTKIGIEYTEPDGFVE